MTLARPEATTSLVDDCLDAAIDRLLSMQDPAGWWKGELQTNVTMDAEDMLLRHVLGISTPAQVAGSAAWIRSQQRPDGTWATFYGGPPDLAVGVEAYVALRLAGDPPDAPHMSAAAAWIRANGGVEATRVFTRIWLSLIGLWSWDDLPVLPPELVLLPRWFPLNKYDFACWARQTVVPLTVVWSYRPVVPVDFDVPELRTGVPPPPRKGFAARAFLALDRVLRGYERCRPPGLRALARRRAVAWVLDRQEADGSWGGIQPPWVYSILMLRLSGMPLEAAPIQRALAGLDRFTIIDAEAGTRRLEACQSPIWDTALAIIALSDAGLAPDHPALVRAAKWLLAKEVKVRGDWAVRRPKLAPGGWAFEFANDNYPDVDDTTEVVLALRRVAINAEAAVERALAWTTGMRSKNGAWGAFDADNTRALLRKLPFCDFGEVIDPPTADVTAHAVEMFAVARMSDCPHVQRAVEWLLDQQEADGSWFGRWGANYLYGTAAVVPALVTACLPTDHPAIRRAVHWLESVQNDDGGWGEDLRSYRETDWRGHGASTASQTAWALLALLAAGEERSRAVTRGVDWLVQTQLANGSWDEPYFTGTGFPGDFYINYHLYRLVFPVMALGRYREALS